MAWTLWARLALMALMVVGMSIGALSTLLAPSRASPLASDNGTTIFVIDNEDFQASSSIIPVKQTEKFVANDGLTENTHVSVTMLANPGKGITWWVEKQPLAGFTVRLTGKPKTSVPFSYVLINDGGP